MAPGDTCRVATAVAVNNSCCVTAGAPWRHCCHSAKPVLRRNSAADTRPNALLAVSLSQLLSRLDNRQSSTPLPSPHNTGQGLTDPQLVGTFVVHCAAAHCTTHPTTHHAMPPNSLRSNVAWLHDLCHRCRSSLLPTLLLLLGITKDDVNNNDGEASLARLSGVCLGGG